MGIIVSEFWLQVVSLCAALGEMCCPTTPHQFSQWYCLSRSNRSADCQFISLWHDCAVAFAVWVAGSISWKSGFPAPLNSNLASLERVRIFCLFELYIPDSTKQIPYIAFSPTPNHTFPLGDSVSFLQCDPISLSSLPFFHSKVNLDISLHHMACILRQIVPNIHYKFGGNLLIFQWFSDTLNCMSFIDFSWSFIYLLGSWIWT